MTGGQDVPVTAPPSATPALPNQGGQGAAPLRGLGDLFPVVATIAHPGPTGEVIHQAPTSTASSAHLFTLQTRVLA